MTLEAEGTPESLKKKKGAGTKKESRANPTRAKRPKARVQVEYEMVEQTYQLKKPIAELLESYARFLLEHMREPVQPSHVIEGIIKPLASDTLYVQWLKEKKTKEPGP